MSKYVTSLIILAVSCTFLSEPLARTAKGATPRKVRHVKMLEVDIEDLVRAESDPDFAEFLQERQRQQQVDYDAIEAHKRAKEAFEIAAEQDRLRFIEWKESQVQRDEMAGFEEHIKAQKERENYLEQQRQQYVAERAGQQEQLETARTARLQRAFPNQRLPASINEPKYPTLKTKK